MTGAISNLPIRLLWYNTSADKDITQIQLSSGDYDFLLFLTYCYNITAVNFGFKNSTVRIGLGIEQSTTSCFLYSRILNYVSDTQFSVDPVTWRTTGSGNHGTDSDNNAYVIPMAVLGLKYI